MFEDWAVIPLEFPLPPVDMTALRSFLQSTCEGCYFQDERIRFTLFHARKPVIDGALLLHTCDPRFAFNQPGTTYNWDPVFAASFPELVRWFETFPFTALEVVTFLVQTDEVPAHLDLYGNASPVQTYERCRHLEPMHYRVLFAEADDRQSREASFHVLREPGGSRQYLHLPQETAAFAVAASTCYHAADYHRGNFKATAAVSGTLDPERHAALLTRSLQQFERFAIRLETPGPVAGPAAATIYD